MSVERPTNLLPVFLQPETVPIPFILNEYIFNKDGKKETIYLVEIPHNDAGIDPESNCSGKVLTSFSQEQKGEKQSVCQTCQQPVTVNVSIIRIELNLI